MIITVAQHDNDFSNCDKTNNDHRAILYCPQSIHGLLGECVVLTNISQHLQFLDERHEKWNGSNVCIGQKRIFEINREACGVSISAFNVRLPKHDGKRANADEYDDHLEKDC